MRCSIELRVEGKDGPLRVELGTLDRECRGAEDVGLRLEEAKRLLERLQEKSFAGSSPSTSNGDVAAHAAEASID